MERKAKNIYWFSWRWITVGQTHQYWSGLIVTRCSIPLSSLHLSSHCFFLISFSISFTSYWVQRARRYITAHQAEINELSQYSHLNGFSTLWMLQRCLIRSRFFKKDSGHSKHLCGFSPRCTTFIWVLSKWRSLLSNSHDSHSAGSGVWLGKIQWF